MCSVNIIVLYVRPVVDSIPLFRLNERRLPLLRREVVRGDMYLSGHQARADPVQIRGMARETTVVRLRGMIGDRSSMLSAAVHDITRGRPPPVCSTS
jgi:hypothetical protein